MAFPPHRWIEKVGAYAWFDRNARADHHFRDRAHHLWTSKAARARALARQEPGRVQEGLERAEEHARGRDPDRGAEGKRKGNNGKREGSDGQGGPARIVAPHFPRAG